MMTVSSLKRRVLCPRTRLLSRRSRPALLMMMLLRTMSQVFPHLHLYPHSLMLFYLHPYFPSSSFTHHLLIPNLFTSQQHLLASSPRRHLPSRPKSQRRQRPRRQSQSQSQRQRIPRLSLLRPRMKKSRVSSLPPSKFIYLLTDYPSPVKNNIKKNVPATTNKRKTASLPAPTLDSEDEGAKVENGTYQPSPIFSFDKSKRRNRLLT